MDIILLQLDQEQKIISLEQELSRLQQEVSRLQQELLETMAQFVVPRSDEDIAKLKLVVEKLDQDLQIIRLMKVHQQEVSCRIQALWCNVMPKYIWYCGE